MSASIDTLREASNILWSADNGGHNGRPSEIKRILRKILAESEVTA